MPPNQKEVVVSAYAWSLEHLAPDTSDEVLDGRARSYVFTNA